MTKAQRLHRHIRPGSRVTVSMPKHLHLIVQADGFYLCVALHTHAHVQAPLIAHRRIQPGYSVIVSCEGPCRVNRDGTISP